MAYNLQKSSFLSPGRPALAPRVCSRNSSRVATPVRALFGFGAPKKAVVSKRALELEDELFATVRGAQPGKLAPKNEEKFDEIISEIRSFGDRNATRNLSGEYKLLYASRQIGPSGVVSAKNQTVVFGDGEVSQIADLAVFGVTLGSSKATGDLKITGSNSYKVVFSERVVKGISENLLPKRDSDSPPEFRYNVFYLGTSAFVVTASISTSDKEPVVLVFRKAGVKPTPQPAETEAPPKREREGRAGRATRAEREYRAQAKQPAPAPAAAAKEEVASEKKSSGGLFGGFFAPPRYVDNEEAEEEVEEVPAPRGRGRAKAAPAKPRSKSPAAAKGKAEAAAKAKAEAAARAEEEAAKRREAAEQKAAEAAAKKERAAAERAAAQQKKQEIQEFLKQLAADVKAAQAESKNAIQTFRDASRQNADLLKESNVARQLIEQAEASVLEAAEEVEELSSAEKKAANDLREAQKQLQKLSK